MTLLRRALIALVAAGFVAVGVVPVAADDLETELAEVEQQMNDLAAAAEAASQNRSSVAGDIRATETTMAQLLADLGQTRIELALVQEDLATQQTYLDLLQGELRDLYLEIAGTRSDLGESREDAADWAVRLYMSAGTKEAGVALVADDLSSVSIGLAYLDRISETTDLAIHRLEALQQLEVRQQARIEDREAAAQAEVAALSETEAYLNILDHRLTEQQAAVEAELAKQKTLLRSIDDEIAHFDTELAGLEAEQDRIEQAIADAAKAREDDEGSGGSGGGDTAGSAWVRPVPGAVTSPFGPRLHPILGYTRMHTGVDFSAPYGQNIRAASSGVVIMATSFGGYGNTTVIDHGNGVTTLYAHQSGFAVGNGATVSAGDVIGYIGSTGFSTGPHLHFEVRINGSPVDPLGYL